MKNDINIACCTSTTFYMPTTVMLTSLLENNKDVHVNVFIVSQKQTIEVEQKFKSLEKRYDCSINLIYFDLGKYIAPDQKKELITNIGRYTEAAIFRLFLPDLLPHVGRVIYLDGDIVVTQSLSELYNMDLHNYSCGACINVSYLQGGRCPTHIEPFLPAGYKYLNSGVMLLDLAKLRMNHISEQLWRTFIKNIKNFRFKDQDAYSCILGNDILLVSQKWNFRQGLWYTHEVNAMLPENQNVIKQIIQNKDWAIVHFSNPVKPWDRASVTSFSPLAHLWWKYLRLSPYSDWEKSLKDVSLKAKIKYAAARVLWNLHIPIKFRKLYISM